MPSPHACARNNRHIPCICDDTGHWRLLLLRGRLGIAMTVQAHDTTTAPAPAARPARRADAGTVRLSQRDIDGLLLAGEHYGAPLDLLAAALRVEGTRLPAIMARWRRAGYAATGRLGPGPGWCWLTRDGMAATGLRYPALRPSLGRLAHIRAVLAARLWLAAGPVWADGQAWWHSERRLRADLPAAGRGGHVPDAEIHWPSIAGSPYAGQVWAVEVELTPEAAGPHDADPGRAAVPDAVRAGDLPDRPGRRAGGHPGRRLTPGGRPGPGGGPGPARVLRWARSWPGERVVVAEADRLPVAAPQGGQGHRVAAGLRDRDRGVAADPGHRGRVYRGVAARLAARQAAPGRGLVAGHAPGVAGRRGPPSPPAAGGRAGPGPGLGARLALPGRRWSRPASSCCSPRSRSRPGSPWPPGCGRGGTTPSPPGWAASPPPRRSPSTPGSGNGRSARPGG